MMSPREKGKRTIGAYVDATPASYLRICFRWPRGRRGTLYRITTEYRDTEANRRELERVRDLIGAEIRNGVFDPTRRFPSLFVPRIAIEPLRRGGYGLAEDLGDWILEQEARKVRASRIRDYRSHLDNYFKPSDLGDADPVSLTVEQLRAFQTWLVSRAGAGETPEGVSEKTAQNVMRGTLRAFLRDRSFPLAALDALRWERSAPNREQDPFTAEQQLSILEYFKARRPIEEYVSLELRFQGISPSEVRGLNVGDFERSTSSLRISRSRHLGAEGPTKTRARERVAMLDERVAADVALVCGIRDRAVPMISVAEDTLRDNFTKALVALGIGHRSLYQAKHTYATLELLSGQSPAIVARNLGISLATLEKHYAAALQKGRVGLRNSTLTPTSSDAPRFPSEIKRPRRDLKPSHGA